jgi:hypothetical protein
MSNSSFNVDGDGSYIREESKINAKDIHLGSYENQIKTMDSGSFAEGSRPSCSKPDFKPVAIPKHQITANNTQKTTFRGDADVIEESH